MNDARSGEAALAASKYHEAIEHFTKALATNATAVKYYINRSTAYQRAARYTEALSDAEIAVVLATKRGARELIKDAQFRRALALFFLGQFADTEHVLKIVKKLDEKEKMLPIWEMKVAGKLRDLPEDDEKRKVTIKDVPDVELPSAPATSKPAPTEEKEAEKKDAAPKLVVPTPANKIKHDWYQNNDTVTITILAKGAPKDATTVEFEKDTLSVAFPIQNSADYNFALDPLYAPIDPAESKYRVLSTKVEVTLKKATPGVKWHNLEGDRVVEADKDESKTSIPSHILTGKTNESAPVYPTSSKSGAKNWDKLVVQDLDDKDDIEGDETSFFFKKLYKDATPEQQRAMMKSYQESGGTVLSTDWDNVGSKTVVPEPPDGMEAKKY
ncbi:SGS-domain-containing protein [Setomelanomma holmii]|uniref:SGS-domain-containing protein n=1 Tax=Setomelanomma holmii TaxID=210430 RepID=A0A9P4H098_9PLEO|nr:SGS-domain-containing protein [Setomelanomma holmii]